MDDVAAGVIAEGFVRAGDDAASDLRVKMLAVEGRLSLITDKMELGVWSLSDVLIEQVDLERFDLTIDGETIAFFPEAPAPFSSLKFVSKRSESASGNRRSARSEQQPSPSPKASTRRHRARERRAEARRARAEGAEKRRRARRACREAKATERRSKKQRRREAPHPMRRRVIEIRSSATRRVEDKLRTWRVRGAWRTRLGWYRVLDELRRIGFFPFDRIPLIGDEMRREPGHEHSFEPHAAPAGIIREICSCGKIRLSSRPIELEGPAWLRAARSAEDASE